MTMFFKIYAISLFVFLAFDMAWLGIVAKNFYRNHLGFLMKGEINWIPAGIFYLLFMAGPAFFVIVPAVQRESWMYAVFAGAFFGLIAYATYDLTNHATITNWPPIVTVVDLVWGAVLSALVSGVTYAIVTKGYF